MTLTVPSFAKINWTLEVLGKRSDGYHELRTILQTISLGDELGFELLEDESAGIEIRCNRPDVPTDERNLVHKAARLLAELANITPRVRIELRKNIPAAAGLGGGSSNAAVMLLVLPKLWKLNLSSGDLLRLAAKLGADVPCFLLGGTSIGIGRGDEVYPLPDIRCEHLLLVNAGIEMPTAEVYGNLPAELTKTAPVASMPFSLEAACAHFTQPGRPVEKLLRNDLEHAVLARHPLLEEIRQRLMSLGASGAMMSGSGSTMFAVFDSAATLAAAQAKLSESGWWIAPARTLGREEYQQYFRNL